MTPLLAAAAWAALFALSLANTVRLLAQCAYERLGLGLGGRAA